MAGSLSFEGVKSAILDNTKRLEVCPAYQAALLATTFQELITAGIELIAWSYQAGVVDDSLLAAFPESTLNTNGIYSTGTFTLTNPSSICYIVKDATVTINVNGTAKADIYAMGDCSLTLNMTDTAYGDLKCFNGAAATINLADDATLKLHTRENTQVTIENNGNAVVHFSANGQSITTYTGNDTSYFLVSAYMNAIVNYTLHDSAEIQVRTYGKAKVVNHNLMTV